MLPQPYHTHHKMDSLSESKALQQRDGSFGKAALVPSSPSESGTGITVLIDHGHALAHAMGWAVRSIDCEQL